MGCCESIESDIEEEHFISRNVHGPVRDIEPVRNSVSAIQPTTIVPPRVWDTHELLAETEEIDPSTAKNIVHLFENYNTIPFICRYRRDLISSNITPDKLRDIKNTYTEIVGLRKRAEFVIRQLEQLGVINDDIRGQILGVKTVEELEFLHGIYTPANKDTRLYEVHAFRLLFGNSPPVQLECIVDHRDLHFDTIKKVNDVICEIISDHFSAHTGVREEWRRLQRVLKITLVCTKKEVDESTSTTTSAEKNLQNGNRNDQSKYEQYFNFKNDVRFLKPHQILAINRGEKDNFLKVTLNVPEELKNYIKSHIRTIFMCNGIQYSLRNQIFEKAFKECYTTKLLPLLYKQVREQLTEEAQKAQLRVFAKNLKQLLLTPPLKGERILGIDPGFTNGCKLALISEMADVLEVDVVHPHNELNDPDKCGIRLAEMLTKNCCKRIALGNGTGCRETEAWLTKLFDRGILNRESVRYDIVSERGASCYSCSKDAKKEFPDMDVTLISAVSIARRLNDPLSEYIKIPPNNLGIGMYQHDIDKQLLWKSLREVVSECVSYVGVDINTASLNLLKHVAGLNEKCAESIIQHRRKRGPFRTRKDLLRVKTLGEERFLQCAGFIRIEPKSVGGKVKNVLDCTWVHPEDYPVATNIINKCDLNVEDIGKQEFIVAIQTFVHSYTIECLANYFNIPAARLKIVLEALQRQLFQDYRSDNIDQKPLFKKDITKIENLFIGEIVTGEVRNIVDFGAFVDIGLKCDALIHKSKMSGIKLNLGDRVTTSVLDIDITRKYIELRLDEVI